MAQSMKAAPGANAMVGSQNTLWQLEDKPQIKQWGLPYIFVKAWNDVAGHSSKKVFTDASLVQN